MSRKVDENNSVSFQFGDCTCGRADCYMQGKQTLIAIATHMAHDTREWATMSSSLGSAARIGVGASWDNTKVVAWLRKQPAVFEYVEGRMHHFTT